MNNCLALDIDGILNNLTTDRYGPYTNKDLDQMTKMLENTKIPPNALWLEHTFSLELSNLQVLRVLIKKYSIKHILICSTWRLAFSLTALKMMFISKGYPDIAALFDWTTGILDAEQRAKFKSKRERVAEILHSVQDINTHAVIIEKPINKWYVLDDDVTNSDLETANNYNISSLYFEFKSLVKEYKSKEEALLNSLAFDRDYEWLEYEVDNEEDVDSLKRIKNNLKEIKSLISDPNIKLEQLISGVIKESERLNTNSVIWNVCRKGKVNKISN